MDGREAKYVVISDPTSISDEIIIPFSSTITHKVMAQRLIQNDDEVIMSAGFIRFMGSDPVCYGRSISLGLNSRPEDDTLLAKFAFGEDCW